MKIASARAVRPPMARRHPARNLFIHVPPPCRADAPLQAGAGRSRPPLQHRLDLRRLDRHIGRAVVVAGRNDPHGFHRAPRLQGDASLFEVARPLIRRTVVRHLGITCGYDGLRQLAVPGLEVHFAAFHRLLEGVEHPVPLPAGARVSVTHDNGTEFAHHERLRDGLGMATYFADPYSSWQRGSNENRNGMIRRYLPKRCEIRMDMAKEVREIVDEINNRPMRVLGYRTPAEAFADELLELQDQQGCCTSK